MHWWGKVRTVHLSTSGRFICCGFLFFLAGYAAQAQSLTVSPRPVLERVHLSNPAIGDYDLVVALVQFQPDTSRFTTGTGRFDGPIFDDGLISLVDPLPHDSGYFKAHLQFLEDYVSRVSDGKASVSTHILPGVITVSQTMDLYSPIGLDSDSDAQLIKLASLVDEVWRIADEEITFDVSNLDPERTAFAFFHAGVGRDIELIGTTLDKTPFDLPSLYFDTPTIERLVPTGLSTFKGIPVESTIVLPRTESRAGTNFVSDTRFLAEFSINGLIAASFFNFLGVPDLFNTTEGTSAIGPFGLMDPLGIFAFNGLFPPEPSAWTKLFLGWADEVEPSGEETSLTAVSDDTGSDVRKINISDSEYFLVENRNRDPEADGLIMQVYTPSGIVQQRVDFDDETFNSRTIEGFIGGVVVSVDNYDWALPGGVDDEGTEYRGGALVWHVDERIIASGLETNSVNADPEYRGVDLEEADSAEDLGFPPRNPFAPPFDLGTPFDYFYEGNPVTIVTATGTEVVLYENRFGADTYPNSDNNGGGPSFIELAGFSQAGQTMTFEESRDRSASLVPSEGFVPGVVGPSQRDGLLLPFGPERDWVAVQGSIDSTVHIFDSRVGKLASVDADMITVTPSDHLVALDRLRDDAITLFWVPGDNFRTTVPMPSGLESGFLQGPLVALDDSSFAVAYSDDSVVGVVIIEDGRTTRFEPIDDSAGKLLHISLVDTTLYMVGTRGLHNPEQGTVVSYAAVSEQSSTTMATDNSGVVAAVFSPTSKLLTVVTDSEVDIVDLNLRFGGADLTESFSVVPIDFDGDGIVEFLITHGDTAVGMSRDGTVVNGFPLKFSSDVLASPLIYSSDGRIVLVAATANGYLYEYASEDGGPWDVLEGFPLSIGEAVSTTPSMTSTRVVTVSSQGGVLSYQRAVPVEVLIGQRWLTSGNASFIDVSRDTQPVLTAEGRIVDSETYVWPNPVRDGTANLRVGTSRDCSVTVTIIDRAGRFIDEISIGEVTAGIPKEQAWTTDVGSGIYYGRVTAMFESGVEEHKIIKIAVIR